MKLFNPYIVVVFSLSYSLMACADSGSVNTSNTPAQLNSTPSSSPISESATNNATTNLVQASSQAATDTDTSSKSCFKESLYHDGSKYTTTMVYTLPNEDSFQTSVFKESVEIKDNVSFEGKSTIRQAIHTPEMEGAVYYSLKDGYLYLHGSNTRLLDALADSLLVYNPPIKYEKIDMEAGEVFTIEYPADEFGEASTHEVIYQGRETITVPIGTVNTCLFEKISPDDTMTKTWVIASGPYQGLEAKIEHLTSNVVRVGLVLQAADVSGLR